MQNGGGGGALGLELRTAGVNYVTHKKNIKYAGGNASNLRNHISRFHPVLLTLSVQSIYFCVFVLNAPVVFCAQT